MALGDYPPNLVASMDQLGASLGAFARPFWEYYSALVDCGFEEPAALEMTLLAQSTWLEALLMDDAQDDP